MGGPPKRSVTRAREEIVWEQAARGKTLKKIAEAVDRAGLGRMSYQAVALMLSRLEDRFLAEQQERIAAHKSRQTASLLHIFGEAMEAWEKSKRPARTKKIKTTQVVGANGLERIEIPAEEVTRTIKCRDGDTQYLAKAMEAHDRIRKIWGLDMTPDQPSPEIVVRMTSEQAEAIQDAAAQILGSHSSQGTFPGSGGSTGDEGPAE